MTIITTSSYPSGKDSFDPPENDKDLYAAEYVEQLQNIIKAIEDEIGLNVSGSRTDLLSRLAILMASNGAFAQGTAFPTDPAPVEGQPFYRSDSKLWYIYDGSAWVQIGGGMNLPSYADGSETEISSTSEVSFSNTSYAKKKGTTEFAREGVVSVSFYHKGNDSTLVTTRLYKKGVYDGIHSANRNSSAYDTSPVLWTGINVSAGDTLELWCVSSSGSLCYVKDFFVMCSASTKTSIDNFILNGYNINLAADDD